MEIRINSPYRFDFMKKGDKYFVQRIYCLFKDGEKLFEGYFLINIEVQLDLNNLMSFANQVLNIPTPKGFPNSEPLFKIWVMDEIDDTFDSEKFTIYIYNENCEPILFKEFIMKKETKEEETETCYLTIQE